MAQDNPASPPGHPGGASLRRILVGAGVVLLLAAAGGAGWWYYTRTRGPDMACVMHANNRGVGLMEQFQYGKAATAFEEVVTMAPDWLPGRVNLGIALLNVNKPETLTEASRIFREVLRKDPDNLHAHFCLGIILYTRGRLGTGKGKAGDHFEFVTKHAPDDPAAWYWLGKSLEGDSSQEAVKCYEQALRLDPQISSAYYALYNVLGRSDPARAQAAREQWQALAVPGDDKDTRGNKLIMAYGLMGRYATVIGRAPDGGAKPRTGPLPRLVPESKLPVTLARGVRWATRADFGSDTARKWRAWVRERFGAVMVVLDYNRDGRMDLFLLGAVVRDGKIGDLLLRNDGHGRFTDVTAEAGLAAPRPSLGCCVADYDNDGYPDLLITGAGEQHLFRNTGKGAFEDVTDKTGLDQLKTVCLGAAFVDLDQDGDLDLVVAQYAAPDAPVGEADKRPTGGWAVFLNTGEALPGPKQKSMPLTTRFRRVRSDKDPHVKDPAALLGKPVPAVNLAVSDLDRDSDLDLLLLADGQPPTVAVNDRLLRFHQVVLPEGEGGRPAWNGALVLDVGHGGRSDLLLVGPGRAPLLLRNQPGANPRPADRWFRPTAVEAPPLLQAQAVDLDFDGWTDVVGLSEKHVPVFLHNSCGKLVHIPEALGADKDWPKDLAGLVVADFLGTGSPSVMAWSEGKGLTLHVNQPNGNYGLLLDLTGERRVESAANSKLRTNADGFGTKIAVQSGTLWTDVEKTTLAAGLGQSSQPVFLGLGKYSEAEVLRLHWADNTLQAELNVPGGKEIVRVAEKDRRTGSCPILFTWDGERFTFVTDFLGAGSVGELQPDGSCRMPRPEESVKIEARQLKPQGGEYVLKIAEPMDEVTYLDRLQLIVLDHPAGVAVYPDERFTDTRTPPSQDLLAFRKDRRIFPHQARDHRGRDVTRTLRKWDRDTVAGFCQRSWLGLAEEHWVELDFGDRLKDFGPADRLVLCLAGWTDYPYPESIWAAAQAGVAVQPPVLERLRQDGAKKTWEPVVTAAGRPVDVGFPAGLPRLMTFEMTGLVGKDSRQPLAGPSCVLRLRTNMEIYWDQAYVAPLLERVDKTAGQPRGFRCHRLEVGRADLAARGLMQEFSPDGKAPTMYDYDRVERVPVSRLAGRLTRYGPVTELLRQADDRFVLFGPGDVLTARFDARSLPPLPEGWERSFVLRTWGYCKDAAPFTATSATVEPLPFRAMSRYPYGPGEHYPRDRRHEDYRRKYNTRPVGRAAP